MRQVDRSSVDFPNRLRPENLTDVNREQLTDHLKISSAVYRHQDVQDSLQELYFDKCYICECDVSAGYKVEHYLPKQRFPHLGYTWSNLHKSCEGCNLAKEHENFFVKNDAGETIDINLLDPSDPNYNISDYMKFNINSIAELITTGNDPIVVAKAKNTIKYLNGKYKNEYSKGLTYNRENKSKHFLQFFISNLCQYRELLQEINRNGVDAYVEPQDPIERDMHAKLCAELIKVDETYLSDKVPFSSCTRVCMFQTLKIPYKNLLAIKDKIYEAINN